MSSHSAKGLACRRIQYLREALAANEFHPELQLFQLIPRECFRAQSRLQALFEVVAFIVSINFLDLVA